MITSQPVNNHDDMHKVTDNMLREVGLSIDDCGGTVSCTSDSVPNVYSLILKHDLNSRARLLLEHDLLNSVSRTGTAADNFEAYSLASYLFYKLDRNVQAGFRFEWLRDDDGFVKPFGSDSLSAPGSYYEATLGLNWSAKPHLRIRPEIRYDWQVRDDNSLPAAFDDGNETQQWLFACDVLWEF